MPDGRDPELEIFGDEADGESGVAGSRSARREEELATADKKRGRKVLIAALVLLLVPALAIGGYALYLNQLVSGNVKHADLLPDSGPTGVDGKAITEPKNNGTNYLLLGTDAREGISGNRSDVMVLAHVPENRKNVTLIHFPRDLYVEIPGKGKNKINAAYAFGGAPLVVETMQNLLGVKVDHVAMVGFDGFKRMTDAVGGVDVRVEESSTSGKYTFTEGTTHMNGDEALAFVRERKQLSEGDISRGRRQQAFIKGLMLKSLSTSTLANPVKLRSFLDAASSNLTVDRDLKVGDMRSEAFAMRGLRGGDIRFITAPFSGYGRSPSGASIDIVDENKMTEMGTAIRQDELETYRE